MGMTRQQFQWWINKFGWLHQGLGLVGALSFFVGSVFFLWKDPLQLYGIWLFIIGSFGMLIGNIGTFLLSLEHVDD